MTAERALPGLAVAFELHRLRIEAEHEGGFTELADYVAVGYGDQRQLEGELTGDSRAEREGSRGRRHEGRRVQARRGGIVGCRE